jgi:hypothetical protein
MKIMESNEIRSSQCKVLVHRSAEKSFGDGEWALCFQECTWTYHNPVNDDEEGYRFIWKRPDGSLQARGAARLPSIKDMIEVMSTFYQEMTPDSKMPDQFRDITLLKLISSINDICKL